MTLTGGKLSYIHLECFDRFFLNRAAIVGIQILITSWGGWFPDLFHLKYYLSCKTKQKNCQNPRTTTSGRKVTRGDEREREREREKERKKERERECQLCQYSRLLDEP